MRWIALTGLFIMTTLLSVPTLGRPSSVAVYFKLTRPVFKQRQRHSLRVKIVNRGTKSLPLMRFKRAGCFAHFYLDIALSKRLKNGDTKPISVRANCPLRSWPGKATVIAPGQQLQQTVDLRSLVPRRKFGVGTYEIDVNWDSGRLEKHFDGKYAFVAGQTSLDLSTFHVVRRSSVLKIRKGQRRTLFSGLQLKFVAHGHNRVRAGQRSPLMISLKVRTSPKVAWADEIVSVMPHEQRVFSVDDHMFELLDYVYGATMRLRYFGRFPSK